MFRAMSNITLDLIKSRVSVNLFDEAASISDDEIADLVAYARQAPSSFNFQNWRFIAVREATAKERLKAVAYGQPKVSQAAVTFIVIGLLNPQNRLADALAPSLEQEILDQATVDTWIGMATAMYGSNPALQRDEAIRSASLAAMTLMLAAEAKGFVSGAMIGFDPAGVSTEFSLETEEVPVMLLTVGRAAAGNWPRKPRFPVAEILKII